MTLLMLSSKIHKEYYYSNLCSAIVSGTNIKDINTMEMALLQLLDYDLHRLQVVIILFINQFLLTYYNIKHFFVKHPIYINFKRILNTKLYF